MYNKSSNNNFHSYIVLSKIGENVKNGIFSIFS